MTRELVGAIVVALAVGLGTTDAAAQLRVAVGINAPPVAARIVFGDAIYFVDRYYLADDAVYVLPAHGPRRAVIYGPYAYRYRDYYRWVDYERARLHRYHVGSWEYRKGLREFERERAKRERELEREYHRWLRDHRYDDRRYDDRPGRGRGRGRGHGRH
jgi:hypothetical protein